MQSNYFLDWGTVNTLEDLKEIYKAIEFTIMVGDRHWNLEGFPRKYFKEVINENKTINEKYSEGSKNEADYSE